MFYFTLALSVLIATATACIGILLHDVGLLPVVGLALSAFGFGFILGEQNGSE
jgi:hypothetical protein